MSRPPPTTPAYYYSAKYLGPAHPNALGCTNNLATSYQHLGRYADAAKLHESMLPIMREKLPNHAYTINRSESAW